MPAFPLKATTSANLYSKFVVKGLKDNKIPVVRNALEKKIDKRFGSSIESDTISYRLTQPDIRLL